MWECKKCFEKNPEEVDSCNACLAPRPKGTRSQSAPVPSLFEKSGTRALLASGISAPESSHKLAFWAKFFRVIGVIAFVLLAIYSVTSANVVNPYTGRTTFNFWVFLASIVASGFAVAFYFALGAAWKGLSDVLHEITDVKRELKAVRDELRDAQGGTGKS